jgi:hypothetical protein
MEPTICPFCSSTVDRDTVPVDPPQDDVRLNSFEPRQDAKQPDVSNFDHPAFNNQAVAVGPGPDVASHQPWSQLPRPVLIIVASREEIAIPAQCVTFLGRRDEKKNIYPHIDFTNAAAAELGVSRQHARIIQTHNGIYVEDLNSTNGTFVNGQRLVPATLFPLDHGDMLHLGQLRLAVSFQ